MNSFLMFNFDDEGLSLIQYFFDIIVIIGLMCMLIYLSFSIVKKNQLEDKFESQEQENKKIKQKIDIKNQIEIIQSGIVKIDSTSYIIPARKNHCIFIFDQDIPKIQHCGDEKPKNSENNTDNVDNEAS